MRQVECIITQEIFKSTDFMGGTNPCYAKQAMLNAGIKEDDLYKIYSRQIGTLNEDMPSTCGNESLEHDLLGLDEMKYPESNKGKIIHPTLPLKFTVTVE